MRAADVEVMFHSIQFGKWALENANKIWVNNYTESMWLYHGKACTTEELYKEYLITL